MYACTYVCMYVCMYVGQTHKDKDDKKAHDEMGFEDFFDVQLLRSHSGFHLLHMDEFLSKEGTKHAADLPLLLPFHALPQRCEWSSEV